MPLVPQPVVRAVFKRVSDESSFSNPEFTLELCPGWDTLSDYFFCHRTVSNVWTFRRQKWQGNACGWADQAVWVRRNLSSTFLGSKTLRLGLKLILNGIAASPAKNSLGKLRIMLLHIMYLFVYASCTLAECCSKTVSWSTPCLCPKTLRSRCKVSVESPDPKP